jgi:hypothetical protein
MRQSALYQFVALAMIVVFPAAVFAADTNGAMMVPSGSVSVNGTAVSRSTAAFPGDKITTAAKSGATLMVSGSSVQVGPESLAVFQPKTIEVGTGAAAITTSAGLQGRVLNLKLTPEDGATKYQFGLRGDKVYVAVLEGTVNLSDGKQQMSLAAGKAIGIPVHALTGPQNKGQGQGGGATAGAQVGVALSNFIAMIIAIVIAILGIIFAVVIPQIVSPKASPVQ